MKASVLVAQANAPWGLSRISQRFPETGEYFFDSSAGEGTFTYVIDTGINVDHLEFEGRAIFAANFAGDGQNTDGAGHGTHVAGTVGSRAYGVAKRTKLIGIKVLGSDGSGSNGDVLAGIDYAVTHAKAEGLIGKAVANLSLGGPRSRASNRVVESAVREGMFMAVAAGNEGVWTAAGIVGLLLIVSQQSANDASPASAEGACTVGATESDDDRADFSNFGDAGKHHPFSTSHSMLTILFSRHLCSWRGHHVHLHRQQYRDEEAFGNIHGGASYRWTRSLLDS